MIVISAHKDTVMNHFEYKYEDGEWVGLLDNQIGMLVAQSLLIDDPVISFLETEGKIKFLFGNSEEWGTIMGMPKYKKDDIIIVVDICCGPQYKGLDFALENIHGFKGNEVPDFVDALVWEGFNFRVKDWNGDPEDEDEAWFWKKQGNKVISFAIPIICKDSRWHTEDCSISIESVIRCKQGLKRLINYLL